VVDSHLNPEMVVKKRRTKRIIQSVPLTVTGVDALGRSFQERTSTLTINCQGCRYQSKHYVLKNMWVTLEIPHHEPGREPRTVRARVNWIQRPRTVRELFQIGVELEVSGNVWGIAFPPSDWFPFPEASSSRDIPAPTERPGMAPPRPKWIGDGPPGPSLAPESPEDNVRVIPIAGGKDESAQVTQQGSRLAAEGKPEIRGAARESAGEAVASDSPQLEGTQREILESRVTEQEATLSALREEVALELSRQVGEARKQIDAQLAEVERARQSDFEKRIENRVQAAIQKLENLTQALGARENEARVTMEQMRLSSEQAATNELRLWQEQMDQRSADAQARLAEMDRAAKSLREQIAAAAAVKDTGWRGTLDNEMESATERWRERTEKLIEEASRVATENFWESAQATGKEIEKQLHQRIADIGDRQSQVAAEGEDTVSMLRAAINQEIAKGDAMFSLLQESASQLEAKRNELSAEIEAASRSLAQRGKSILEAQSSELTHRAESLVAGMPERLQSAMEATGRKIVDELAADLHERLAPQMARVEEAANKLMFDRDEAEKTLVEHQQLIWQASDRNLQDTVARGKELLAQLETEFSESGREMIAKWISELESKATETSQSTFEALYKSADWYEKKVQNQMQTTLQKGVEQAAAHLRDKAAELSGTFAQEVDRCSRSYVEHAQGQIRESATEATEKAAQQIADGGVAAAALFQERASQIGQQQFEAYSLRTKSAFEQNVASMEASGGQVRAKLEGDARGFAGEFQRALSQHVQQTLAQGIQEMASQIDQASANLRNEYQTLQRQFGSLLEPVGIAAIDEHKKRLETASHAWLLTTVTKLTRESEKLIAELAETTEKKLKAVCSGVITEMAATLRQRLGGPAGPVTPPHAPPTAIPPREQK
jgi:hypothetical protein